MRRNLFQCFQVYVFFALLDENWQEARKLKYSSQHILQPLDVKVEFSRAMVVTDARMPKYVCFRILKFCGEGHFLGGKKEKSNI